MPFIWRSRQDVWQHYINDFLHLVIRNERQSQDEHDSKKSLRRWTRQWRKENKHKRIRKQNRRMTRRRTLTMSTWRWSRCYKSSPMYVTKKWTETSSVKHLKTCKEKKVTSSLRRIWWPESMAGRIRRVLKAKVQMQIEVWTGTQASVSSWSISDHQRQARKQWAHCKRWTPGLKSISRTWSETSASWKKMWACNRRLNNRRQRSWRTCQKEWRYQDWCIQLRSTRRWRCRVWFCWAWRDERWSMQAMSTTSCRQCSRRQYTHRYHPIFLCSSEHRMIWTSALDGTTLSVKTLTPTSMSAPTLSSLQTSSSKAAKDSRCWLIATFSPRLGSTISARK